RTKWQRDDLVIGAGGASQVTGVPAFGGGEDGEAQVGSGFRVQGSEPGSSLLALEREGHVVNAGRVVHEHAAAGSHVFGEHRERRKRIVLEGLIEGAEEAIPAPLLAEALARAFGIGQIVPEAEPFFGAIELYGSRRIAARLPADFAGDQLEIERGGKTLIRIGLGRNHFLKAP